MIKKRKYNILAEITLKLLIITLFVLLTAVVAFSYYRFLYSEKPVEITAFQSRPEVKVLSGQTEEKMEGIETAQSERPESDINLSDIREEKNVQPNQGRMPSNEINEEKQCLWPDMISMDKIGIQAPIIWSRGKTEEDFQQDMRKGVIHYPGTARPGEDGNIFITGHSTYYNSDPGEYKNVFIRLGELEKGDKIKIIISCEHEYNYEIFHIEPVEPDDQRIFDMKNKTERILTLATCWPIGSYEKRLMVKARQI